MAYLTIFPVSVEIKQKEISFKSFLDEFIKEYKMHISVNNQTYDNDDYEYMNYAYKTFENVSISIQRT